MDGRDWRSAAGRQPAVSAPLRREVLDELARHGTTPAPEETPEALRERLNERYLESVRRLRRRQVAGEIPLRDYARHVLALKESYPLLSLPLSRWVEPPSS